MLSEAKHLQYFMKINNCGSFASLRMTTRGLSQWAAEAKTRKKAVPGAFHKRDWDTGTFSVPFSLSPIPNSLGSCRRLDEI